jgi:hypothetical protein
MNCSSDCPRYKICKKLCQEQEKFVDIKTRSFSHRWTSPQVLEEIVNGDKLCFPEILNSKSFRGWVYELYFLDRMSIDEVAYHLPLEEETIEDIVYQIKEDINKLDNDNKKIILKEHLIKGLDVPSTSEKTGFSRVYIYRILKEYIYSWGVEDVTI